MGRKLLGLVAVIALLIFGMVWSLTGSGWVAAAVVGGYWIALWATWKWGRK